MVNHRVTLTQQGHEVQLWRKLPNKLSRFICLVWYKSLLASDWSAKVTLIRGSVKARVMKVAVNQSDIDNALCQSQCSYKGDEGPWWGKILWAVNQLLWHEFGPPHFVTRLSVTLQKALRPYSTHSERWRFCWDIFGLSSYVEDLRIDHSQISSWFDSLAQIHWYSCSIRASNICCKLMALHQVACTVISCQVYGLQNAL